MNDYKLNKVVGGGEINGSVLNALSRFITTLYELGRAVGTSLRRVTKKNMC